MLMAVTNLDELNLDGFALMVDHGTLMSAGIGVVMVSDFQLRNVMIIIQMQLFGHMQLTLLPIQVEFIRTLMDAQMSVQLFRVGHVLEEILQEWIIAMKFVEMDETTVTMIAMMEILLVETDAIQRAEQNSDLLVTLELLMEFQHNLGIQMFLYITLIYVGRFVEMDLIFIGMSAMMEI